MMTLQQAIDYINDFTWSTSRLGLERTEELLQFLLRVPQSLKQFLVWSGPKNCFRDWGTLRRN